MLHTCDTINKIKLSWVIPMKNLNYILSILTVDVSLLLFVRHMIKVDWLDYFIYVPNILQPMSSIYYLVTGYTLSQWFKQGMRHCNNIIMNLMSYSKLRGLNILLSRNKMQFGIILWPMSQIHVFARNNCHILSYCVHFIELISKVT